MSDEFEEIPFADCDELGADSKMPWVYETALAGDPIVYGATGKGVVRWAIGQQVRVMYPVPCTLCSRTASRRGEPAVQSVGLVAILTERKESGRGPTEWVTLCPEHFARRVDRGLG